MIDLVATRRWFTDDATEGELSLNGARECWTLEDRARDLDSETPPGEIERVKVQGKTAIPTGRYRVVLEHSARFGPDTLTLISVPGFKYIRVHAGNKADDTEGCPLVGQEQASKTDNWIGASGAALKALKAKVIPRIRAGEDCWWTVRERPETDERT